jgi:hypothetical protein
MIRPSAMSLTAILALTAASGCSSSSNPATSSADSGPSSACASDPSFKAFAAGISVAGTHGYSFQLIEANPPTPTQSGANGNSWTIKVTNTADGGTVDGFTLKAKCAMKMPGGASSHDCSGGPPPVTPMGGGLYKVSPILFNMPGHWDVQFSVLNGTVVIDSAAIGTCIDQ